MARLIRTEQVFTPRLPQPPAGAAYTADPVRPRRLAAVGLVTYAVASLIVMVAFWVPELSVLPGFALLVEQVGPLTAPRIVSAGIDLTGSQLGLAASLPVVLGLAVVGQWLLVAAKPWVLRAVAAGCGTIAALAAIVQAIVWVIDAGTSSILGLLLLLLVAATSVLSALRGLAVPEDRVPPKRDPRLRWVVVLGLTFFPALAVGRLLLPPTRTLAGLIAADGSSAGVNLEVSFDSSLPWLTWLVGLAFVIGVWGIWVLLPPWRDRKLTAGVAALIVGIAGGSIAGRYATLEADALLEGAPRVSASLPWLCGSWPTVGGQELAAVGPSCRQLVVVDQTRIDQVRSLDHRLGGLGPLRYPDGKSFTGRVAGAVYGKVFVALAGDPAGGAPARIVAWNTATLDPSWAYSCGTGIAGVRFARSSSGDDEGRGALTKKGEGAAVLVTCGTKTLRLSPTTGAVGR